MIEGKGRRPEKTSVVGMAFYDIEALDVFSYCPDSTDASTPATQVHVQHRIRGLPYPFVMRFGSARTLDEYIEALIEHRTFVFGRRDWRGDYPEQESRR